MEAKIEGIEKVNKALESIPVRLIGKIVKIINVNARLMQRYIKEENLTGGTTESRLRVRTGRLRGSVVALKSEVRGDRVEGGVTIGTVYSRVHFGPKGQTTTITPKRGKYLTIPLPAAMTRGGVLRGRATSTGVSMSWGGTAGGYEQASISYGVFGDTFVRKSKAGNLIIFGRLRFAGGKRMGQLRSRIVPLFLLKKQIQVRARIHPEDILNRIRPRLLESFQKKGFSTEG